MRATRFLKPRMLVGGVIHHHLDDHPQTAIVRAVQECLEILESAVAGMNGVIIRDVIAIIAKRRGIKGQQPDGVDAQLLQIIEALRQARKVADAVAVAVIERAHVQLVNDGVFVPQAVLLHRQRGHSF